LIFCEQLTFAVFPEIKQFQANFFVLNSHVI